jgi:hypothetical protein
MTDIFTPEEHDLVAALIHGINDRDIVGSFQALEDIYVHLQTPRGVAMAPITIVPMVTFRKMYSELTLGAQ